jgi:lysophospholipase L1-like esterase
MLRLAHRAGLAVAAFAVTVLSAAGPAHAQTSFSTYVALGDSLTAGFSNGSLVQTHQRNSYPALLARQAAVTGFEQPLVSEPGIPTELALISLVPPVVAAKAATTGAPLRLTLSRPYNNLGVPAATVTDLLTRVTDGGGFHDLVLRGAGTAVAQGLALKPTVITLWTGNNDILGAALRGQAIEGVTMTPLATFRAAFQSVVSAVKASGAFVVAANVPDVASIPYVTTIAPVVVNPATGTPVRVNGQTVPLLGPSGPLPSTALVTLAAAPLLLRGQGIPTALGGTGVGLPDEVVLDPVELAAIRTRTGEFNQAIAEICQAAGIPVLDVNALFADLAAHGRLVGGLTLTGAFLTGGLFGYDGVHPTELGYAIVANEWIRLINAHGGQLPIVDLGPYLGVGSSAEARATAQAAGRGGPAPWTAFTVEAYQGLLAAFPRLDGR